MAGGGAAVALGGLPLEREYTVQVVLSRHGRLLVGNIAASTDEEAIAHFRDDISALREEPTVPAWATVRLTRDDDEGDEEVIHEDAPAEAQAGMPPQYICLDDTRHVH